MRRDRCFFTKVLRRSKITCLAKHNHFGSSSKHESSQSWIGPAPFIAAALFAAYQSGYAIAFYILGCGVISIIAAVLLKDHTNKDIDEYDIGPF